MWNQLTRRHSPRAKALLFSSIICCGYGVAYTPLMDVRLGGDLPAGVEFLSTMIPLWVFGGLWLFFGIAGITVFLARRIGAAVFAGQWGMYMTWALGYLGAGMLGAPRGWVAAILFGGLAGMVAYLTRVEPPMWWPVRWPKWKR